MNSGSNNNNERKQFAFDLNVKPVEDDNSDIPENSDSCTICIEPLIKTRDDRRTLVTLACGHKFHLDCIGSAFNAKGFMQCPNCMQIEPGQWRYAASPPIQNISEGDWIFDEEEEQEDASSVGQIFNSQITAIEEVLGTAPPLNQLISSRLLEQGVTTRRRYAEHPISVHYTPSVHNAPLLLPYPNTTPVQVNRIPPLLGDLLGPVTSDHMFSSGREQAGGISHSLPNLPFARPVPLIRSSSRGGGTSVNDDDGTGVSSSNGRRGGNGDGNGRSGGSHLSGRRPS